MNRVQREEGSGRRPLTGRNTQQTVNHRRTPQIRTVFRKHTHRAGSMPLFGSPTLPCQTTTHDPKKYDRATVSAERCGLIAIIRPALLPLQGVGAGEVDCVGSPSPCSGDRRCTYSGTNVGNRLRSSNLLVRTSGRGRDRLPVTHTATVLTIWSTIPRRRVSPKCPRTERLQPGNLALVLSPDQRIVSP